MIIIHAKPGTLSACFMRVKHLIQKPIVGQVIQTKRWDPNNHRFLSPGERWGRWIVTNIQSDLFLIEAW